MATSERLRLQRPRITLLQSIALWVLSVICGVVALILWITDSGGDAPNWLIYAGMGFSAVGLFSEVK